MRPALFLAPAVLFGLCFWTSPAAPWEDDVHYGLTKWLALRAGYSEQAAEAIGRYNVGADEGMLDARKLVFWSACINRDEGWSRQVKELHFPSGAKVPGLPQDRAVRPGDDWAFSAARNEIKQSIWLNSERADSQRRFAEGLHALQDSWSHQGEPGIPFLCVQTLAWGHPGPRGGWIRHRADLTHEWPEDTMATAKATWTVLEEYAQEKRWVLARQPVDWEKVKAEMSTIWPRLKRDLEEFQIARTKTEKLEWFSSRGFDESSILPYVKRVSLRDGRRPISQVNIPSVSSPSVPPISLAAVPQDVVAFLTAFFSSWVGTTDFAGLAGKFVAASNLAKNLGLQGRPDEIAVTMLALWRVADHGEVERLGGHLPPKPGTQAASELQAILNDRKSFVVTDGIAYAMIPLGVKGPPLALAPMGGNKYAAMGRFRHAPHDVVMAVAEQVDGNWKITEIRSVVDH